jgi:oxygen-independent coproporphyrinogen-3 oxidase
VKPRALYIHIPFCAHLCAYCDFAKVLYEPEWAFSYLSALKKEAQTLAIAPVDTIYIGGGTPSVLSSELLEDLLSFFAPYLLPGGEFTLEANPENWSKEKADICRRYGVNRLSLGAQSSSPRLLSLMGRHHTFQEAQKAYQIAQEAGFDNISVDLIYALPNESKAELQADIAAALSFHSHHLSTYCLSVNPGTVFFNKRIPEMDQALAAEEYEAILQEFRQQGYERYEVSNFAKKGYQSRHNLTYWHDEPYYGLGLGAAGYLNDIRYSNTRNLTAYLSGHYRFEEEKVTPEEDRKYFFLTNLRLAEGFSLATYEKRFGERFEIRYQKEVEKLVASGLLLLTKERVHPTDRGILLLDRILLALY